MAAQARKALTRQSTFTLIPDVFGRSARVFWTCDLASFKGMPNFGKGIRLSFSYPFTYGMQAAKPSVFKCQGYFDAQ